MERNNKKFVREIDGDVVMDNICEFINLLNMNRAIKKSKLKIAILGNEFSRSEGASRVIELQARELSEMGHDITIFAFEADIPLQKNIKIEIIKIPRNFFLNVIYRLIPILNFVNATKYVSKLKRFDLIICHSCTLAWFSYLAKKFYGIKYIYYNHPFILSSELSLHHQKFCYGLYAYLKKYVVDQSIKRSDCVISISKFAKEVAKKETGVNSVVIYNKVDTNKFKLGIDGIKIREKYNLNVEPVILFVGRIVPSKKIDLLIEAFKRVKQKIPNAKLIIVGKHYPLFDDYLKKLKEMCGDSVIFAGYVPDDELPKYYAACDVYATCSIYEGFNIPLVEAQACGKPVVAFNHFSHPEVVQNRKTGYLTRPLDISDMARGIEKAYLNSKELSKNARAWAKKFSLGGAERTEELYLSLTK